jgi:hypothetical protein
MSAKKSFLISSLTLFISSTATAATQAQIEQAIEIRSFLFGRRIK